MLAVCALAGDVNSSRTLALVDVQKAIVSGIAHKDYSVFADTVKALEGNRKAIASVIRASLARLDDSLRNMRGGFAKSGDHVPAFAGFTIADLQVSGKKPATLIDSISVWASGVAEMWLAGVDADLTKAQAQAKAERSAARAAKKAAPAPAEAPAATTEAAAPVAGVAAVGKGVAVAALAAERSRTAARLLRRRAEIARLRAEIARLTLQAAAAQAAAAQAAAKPAKRQAAKKAA